MSRKDYIASCHPRIAISNSLESVLYSRKSFVQQQKLVESFGETC